MEHFWIALAALGLALPAHAQFGDAAPSEAVAKGRAKWPAVHLEITAPRTAYALGDAIPIVMRYRNDGKPGLRVMVVTYDNSGRIMDFGFTGRGDDGKAVCDPVPFQGGFGGGLRSQRALGKYEQTVTLNEWLAFDRPGHYEITAWSGIVEEVGPEGTYGPPVPLQSASLQLDILPPDEMSRQARLNAARAALDAAEKKAAALPPKQAEYERGAQVAAAMRDLRWMGDPRAIPLQLRALELGGSAAFEAHRGLASFPDLAPVRAAIVKRLQSGTPVTENIWAFQDLLARSSPAPRKAAFGFRLTPADEALFNAPVRAALARRVANRDAKGAALDAATLLQNDARAPAEAAIWRAFWLGATSLSEERQWTGALLLLQEKEGTKTTYPVTIRDLRAAARDGHLGEDLRSAAVVALAARGDYSLRPLLTQDVTAPKPHFSEFAFNTLGDFEARPIALRLLRGLRAPESDGGWDRDNVAGRLRDYGRGATLAELVEAARWIRSHYHFDSGEGALLEAVALRDQPTALQLVRESLAKRPAWEYDDARLPVLVRLNVPAAREQVRAFLGQKHADFLTALIAQISNSTHDEVQLPPSEEGHHYFRAPRALSQSLVPELAQLYFRSPSAKVRQTAGDALVQITQVRARGDNPAQMRADLRAWWRKNAARLGRPAALADTF